MNSGPVWRKIAKVQVGQNPGWGKSRFVGGSSLITLECGHFIVRKNSVKVPAKAKCRDCASLRNGSIRKSREVGSDLLTTETWDPVTGMPRVEIRRMTPQEVEEWDSMGRRSDQARRDDEARREADKADREEDRRLARDGYE